MHYDLFNGDADGIIALLQLRLAQPKESILVTGVKRELELLEKIVSKEDVSSVTVLDISMEKNLDPLNHLLSQGVEVFYCDHHRTGVIPTSDKLTAVIDLDAEVCTSLLINKQLNGQFAKWAVVAAFGDNLFASGQRLATEIGLCDQETRFLKQLGTLINYNGYGGSLDDLHIEPANLYRQLLTYPCPLALKHDPSSPYYTLKQGYASDYQHIEQLRPISNNTVARVFELPCEPWARRIGGVFGNELANQAPSIAHGVLTLNNSGNDYTVSVRAPLNNRVGADEICSAFPTGGGRKAAAGINRLPVTSKADFIDALNRYYQQSNKK